MGLETTIVLTNDNLADIENDRDFGKNLADAIRNASTLPLAPIRAKGSIVGRVIETHQSDEIIHLVVGCGCGAVIVD